MSGHVFLFKRLRWYMSSPNKNSWDSSSHQYHDKHYPLMWISWQRILACAHLCCSNSSARIPSWPHALPLISPIWRGLLIVEMIVGFNSISTNLKLDDHGSWSSLPALASIDKAKLDSSRIHQYKRFGGCQCTGSCCRQEHNLTSMECVSHACDMVVASKQNYSGTKSTVWLT